MKTVCCTNMPFAREAFSTLGSVTAKDGRTIVPADVHDADILAIRSTTRVNGDLLDGSRVRFVGTATIGTDHFDIPYLESRRIRWCFAPGCNANSVAEYVVSALLCLATRHGWPVRGRVMGIIGVGNVGRCVEEKARALGMRVLLNDPPRQRSEPDHAHLFVPLDELLARSDVVTLHTPLTRSGDDRTLRLADAGFFARMKPDCVLLNAARGPIVDSEALLRAMDAGTVAHAVLDTWEGEPAYRPDARDRVDLATPHIAGHSFEGKAMGTVMVYEEACRFLGVAPRWSIEGHLPPPPVPEVAFDAAGLGFEATLWELVSRIYDIREDDAGLREGRGSPTELARHFDSLRKNYRKRREFRFTRARIENASPEAEQTVRELGFQSVTRP